MTYKAVLFDAYGTILDVDSAAAKLAASGRFPALADRWPELAALWRARQLNYSWLRSLSGDYIAFWQITCDALDYALEALGLEDGEMRDALLDLYRRLDAYDEVPKVLDAIDAAGLPAAILSNGNHQMLFDAFTHAGLIDRFDAMISVEDVGIYKPSAEIYQLGCKRYDATPHQILFASSNGWDAAAAAHFGYHSLWANRAGMPLERLAGTPHHIGSDLRAIIPLLSSG